MLALAVARVCGCIRLQAVTPKPMEALAAVIDEMIEDGTSPEEMIGYLELIKHDIMVQVWADSEDDEENDEDED